jgi:choline dehydrogenase-like flavoprotein
MRVTFQSHPDDFATMRFLADRQMEILDAAGALKKWTFAYDDPLPSRHLMGTCRMGKDPQRSVVDAFNRTHDVPNLFLVDGSSFVTSARQQPTCTIQALAYRAAAHMADYAKRGEI